MEHCWKVSRSGDESRREPDAWLTDVAAVSGDWNNDKSYIVRNQQATRGEMKESCYYSDLFA